MKLFVLLPLCLLLAGCARLNPTPKKSLTKQFLEEGGDEVKIGN